MVNGPVAREAYLKFGYCPYFKLLKVAIIGCGIAGPVLATFLKLRGYNPIIFERLDKGTESGVSLMLQINGLRVLSLIPGIVDNLPGKTIERLGFYSVVPGDIDTLAESDIPKTHLLDKFGLGMIGVERPRFHKLLVETAENHGIEIKWNHQLASIEQNESQVQLSFLNGHTETASIVIGCDGIHSNTRISLFGKEKADFTGLIQTGGVSPTPAVIKIPTMMNIFGVGAHMITYPISETHSSWAISEQADETRETWQFIGEKAKDDFKSGPFSQWAFGAGEIVTKAERIVRYGLYDRPALETWYKGRVALLGDAAHPTSPHIGQGANQAFEDIYHLIRGFVKHNPDASAPSTALLETIFAEYESVRISRTARLVKEARTAGEGRVVQDLNASMARNNGIRKMWAEEELVIKGYEQIVSSPFIGETEI